MKALQLFLIQHYQIGYKSLPLISLTGFIVGIVFTDNSRPALTSFGATSWLPATSGVAIIKALAPLITSLICAGKVGSQIGAEFGSMKVTEQIDAMEVSAVNPYKFLVVTDELKHNNEAVGLSETANQFPEELSGGQKKRIGIARTLILKPEIIFYDEPTSGLDPITSSEINDLINEVKERYKTSSIIITHDLTCAKTTSDRIFMLVDGKFIRQGDFEDVFDTDDEKIKGFYDYNFIH